MPRQPENTLKRSFIRLVVMALLIMALPCSIYAGDKESQRIRAGLDLFPSVLAADRDIIAKTGPDGKLLLILAYVDDEAGAGKLASHLQNIKAIRGIPVRIELKNDFSIEEYSRQHIAGIFLTEKITRDLTPLIRFGREHHVIIFSPFKGDVEAGVASGIFINDRILPYVNMQTLRMSSIRLKPFFLRIAKSYE